MQGLFKSKEEVVSMFLGLGIVLAVFFLVVNYFQKRRSGVVDVPGVTTENVVSSATPTVAPTTGSVAVAKPTEVVKQVVGGSEYVVVGGDNLWKIAVNHYGSGYNWVDIAKANKLKKPGNLAVGQKLILPQTEKKVVAEKTRTITGDSYQVARGDSLSKIALMAYGDGSSWQRIWKANANLVKNPGLIRVGWKLVIPR